MKKSNAIIKVLFIAIISVFAFFVFKSNVSAASESIFDNSGLCYYASTQFGEDASTMATIHFHSESKDVYALLTTKDDTSFANATKVELEKVRIDYSAPLAKDPDKPLEQDEGFPEESYECTGRLTGLTPGTDYIWKATDGTSEGLVFNFRTAAGGNEAFTFSYTTDPQTYTGGARWDEYNQWAIDIYNTAEKNKLGDIDFIISGGDVSENSGRAKHWGYMFEPEHFQKSVYMAAPGNHDFTGLISSGSTDGRFFASMFGNPLNGSSEVYPEISYYWMYNDTLFVVLSSSCASRTAQMEWFDQVCKNNPAQYKIVTVHYPTNTDATDTFKEFIPVFQKYNVDLVLFGHTHTYAVQKNYYNRKENSDLNVGTTYISASSPEGDSGSIVNTQLFFQVNDKFIKFSSFSQYGAPYETFSLNARRVPTSQTNNYNEEEFIKSFSADIDQDALTFGKVYFDASAYNNVYYITLKTKDGVELGSRYVTDSVNNYISVSGLTPNTPYDCVATLEYYDGKTVDVDFSFSTNISSYGTLKNLKEAMSAYGYRFTYTPEFRKEVKSLAVYVNGTKVQDATIKDKKISIDLSVFEEEKKYEIEIRGVLEDGTEVPIHSTVYGEDKVSYTVTFVGKDGEELSKVTVDKDAAATAPNAPEVEGYEFKGWDKDFSKVTEDLTITALYEVKKFNVKFLDKDGKELQTVEVEYGKDAEAPQAPILEGYEFKGWDKEFTAVKEDLEVKAIYEEVVVTFTVTFVDKDGNELAKVTVEKDAAATAPNAPEVEGYEFKGWDKDFSKVTEDLEVKALYEAKSTTPDPDPNPNPDPDPEPTPSGCNSGSLIFTTIMLLGLCFFRRKRS